MNEADASLLLETIETRFRELRLDVKEALAEMRGDIRGLHSAPCQAHATRLDELDHWRRGFWLRVLTAVVAGIGAAGGLLALLKGSIKGGI